MFKKDKERRSPGSGVYLALSIFGLEWCHIVLDIAAGLEATRQSYTWCGNWMTAAVRSARYVGDGPILCEAGWWMCCSRRRAGN